MHLIEEYMLKSKSDRQNHLRLNEACIERGGNSVQCRALLAHVLDTTIPRGAKVNLCHACHNDKCNNPNHLYWGTASENIRDAFDNGRKSMWQLSVEKYGLVEATKRQSIKRKKN